MIEIHCKLESLHKGSTNIITGILYLEVNTHLFPEKRWSDFVVVVLENWLDEIIKMTVSDKLDQGRFNFIDGPIYFTIEKMGESSNLKGYHEDKLIINQNISFSEFNKSLFATATTSALISELDKRQWKNQDTENLNFKFNLAKSAWNN